MRKLMLAVFIVLATISCKEKERKQIELLSQEVEALKKQGIEKDSTINEFFKVLNEIESNLAVIKEKEKIIAKTSGVGNEMKDDARERINDDIVLINELMEKNRKSIRYLNKQLKESNLKIGELEERLVQTTKLLEERDQEIVELKDRLAKLNFDIETLNATVDTLSTQKQQLKQEVAQKVDKLNTAWFAYGTKKELIDNKVIDKTGGFLGLGKSTRLKSDFDASYFTQIDITKTTIIPLIGKKATLITTHPAETYKLVINQEGIVEKIEILDVNKFWSASKYLVIQIEQ
jgi:predicted  nucleic acid-binding Zn-ribbon protein